MNADLVAGIAAGVILRDLWCWGYAKLRNRSKHVELERTRNQARADYVAKAHADLNSIPFVVETSNDDDFLRVIRKVHFSLKATDSGRFFNSPNGWEH